MSNSEKAKEHMEKGNKASLKGKEYHIENGKIVDNEGNILSPELAPYAMRGRWELL